MLMFTFSNQQVILCQTHSCHLMMARLVEAFADEMLRPGNLRLAAWMKKLGGLEVEDEGSKIDYDKLLRYAW